MLNKRNSFLELFHLYTYAASLAFTNEFPAEYWNK
jgi:hypothetical protein